MGLNLSKPSSNVEIVGFIQKSFLEQRLFVFKSKFINIFNEIYFRFEVLFLLRDRISLFALRFPSFSFYSLPLYPTAAPLPLSFSPFLNFSSIIHEFN